MEEEERRGCGGGSGREIKVQKQQFDPMVRETSKKKMRNSSSYSIVIISLARLKRKKHKSKELQNESFLGEQFQKSTLLLHSLTHFPALAWPELETNSQFGK